MPTTTLAIRPRLLPWALAAAVIATRLPFLDAGFGHDADAWRVALAAKTIAADGRYVASRFPGYPLHEIASALLIGGGAMAVNTATALLSALAVACFALVLQELGSRRAILAASALALTPVIYLNSVNAMDYVWALACLLASLLWVLRRRPIVAGMLLGLAIGCRITSVTLLPPLALLLWRREESRPHTGRASVLRFALTSGLAGGLGYLPVLLTYGWSFLTVCESGYPTFHEVLSRLTVEVWGQVGLLGLAIAVALGLWTIVRGEADRDRPRTTGTTYLAVWLLAIAIQVVLFLRLPHEAGYLVPAVPFMLLLLHDLLDGRAFALAAVAICAAPFISLGSNGIVPGPIVANWQARQADMRFARQQMATAERDGQARVVVAGPWLPMLEWYAVERPQTMVEYLYSVDRFTAQELAAEGYQIYYIPGQREFNRRVRSVVCAAGIVTRR